MSSTTANTGAPLTSTPPVAKSGTRRIHPTANPFNPMSAHYTLPSAVKIRVDGLYRAASSIAVVTALFASVMATFSQAAALNTNDQSFGWEAIRFFTYGAIINNLIAAMCAMWAMWMYADLPERAHQLILVDENSLPARVARGKLLTREEILHEGNLLLAEFGVYRTHDWILLGEIVWTILGLFLTFLSLTTYVWLTQSRAVAGSLMIFVVPGFFGLVFPMMSAQLETWSWRPKAQAFKKSVTFSNDAKYLSKPMEA